MHVGHLRTTIVGDAIARVTEFVGHHLIRDNHVGDWGTPFGMLIEHLVDVGEDSPQAGLLRTDPNAFYQAARVKFDSDPVFADRARERVVKLQSGTDQPTMELWAELVELSKAYLRDTYARLRVTLTDDDIRGESFYNDMLPGVADDLVAKGLARISDGALCAFPRRVHQPGRHPAAGDHPQERRRLQLLDHRPGHRQVPGRQGQLRPGDLRRRLRPGAALQDGVRGRPRGRLAAGQRRLRARADRHGPGQGRPPAADQGGRPGQAQRPARPRASSGPARSSTRSSGTTRASTSTRSRRTSASARSSTPTCRPRGTARTSSTGTG